MTDRHEKLVKFIHDANYMCTFFTFIHHSSHSSINKNFYAHDAARWHVWWHHCHLKTGLIISNSNGLNFVIVILSSWVFHYLFLYIFRRDNKEINIKVFNITTIEYLTLRLILFSLVLQTFAIFFSISLKIIINHNYNFHLLWISVKISKFRN